MFVARIDTLATPTVRSTFGSAAVTLFMVFLAGVILLYGVLAFLAFVVLAHLSIPYAVIGKHRRGETGGVSGVFGFDWVLLFLAAVIARVTGVVSASTVLLVGSCVIVGSYLHCIAACAVYSWLERRSRLPRMRAKFRDD